MTYRVAIIGLGQIGVRLQDDPRRRGAVTHLAAFAQHPRCQVVAACDPSASARRHVAQRYPTIELYRDVRTMMATVRPDIVGLATPTDGRVDLLRAVLATGPRAILCEKPLCRSTTELRQLLRLPQIRQPVIALNCTRRWDPWHRAAARDLRRGRWGRLLAVDIYYSGSFLSAGAHFLDQLRMFAGEIAWVEAMAPFPSRLEHPFSGRIGLHNGAVATLHPLPTADYLLYEFDLYCTRGRLRLSQSGFHGEAWQAAPHPHFQGYRTLHPQPLRYPTANPGDVGPVVNDLVRCIARQRRPACTLDDGVHTVVAQAAALQSARQRGRRIATASLLSRRHFIGDAS